MNTPIISMIACIGKNGELGLNNKLLWKIRDDLQRFKQLTSGHAIIMGQNTLESIGKALPDRVNIVLTKDINFKPLNCKVCYNIEQSLREASKIEKKEIFIIGGGQMYKQFIPLCDKLYLTIVDQATEADTFFPKYDDFKVCKESEEKEDASGIKYKFLELIRNAKSKR
ncbi:MAG: Dihydrofolate reductase [candidate division WS2 bacterium ADurb.Bin280]|uniref:Dihydrofolate reductase n=1 Tax=candidate division WS2 bacterium ADurb.Bin280 TaxID=1852829 RepID=A0A1V5SCT3_9BACT|nr:MAG: Dihydrofolate reductase [candidate division WS2 bacterium ADurb.Bin280]